MPCGFHVGSRNRKKLVFREGMVSAQEKFLGSFKTYRDPSHLFLPSLLPEVLLREMYLNIYIYVSEVVSVLRRCALLVGSSRVRS